MSSSIDSAPSPTDRQSTFSKRGLSSIRKELTEQKPRKSPRNVFIRIGKLIRASFRSRARERNPFDFGTLDYPEIDIEETAVHLNLKEVAERFGSQNLPAPTSSQFDWPQENVAQFLKRKVGKVWSGYEKRLEALNREITTIDADGQRTELRVIPSKFRTMLGDLKNEHLGRLREAHAEYLKADEDLKSFKKRNFITREPDYPESHLSEWAMLLVALLLEAVFNAFFFMQGLPTGLVGGAIFAGLLALVDVVIMYWVGRVAAWMGATRIWWRVFGFLALGFFLVYAPAYNLVTAHVRENLGGGILLEESTRRALDNFLTNPLGLEQADSWMLALIGIVFSVLALFSGVRWGDSIPFYKGHYERKRENEEEYRALFDFINQRSKDLRDSALEEVSRFSEALVQSIALMEHKVGAKDTLRKAVERCVTHYEESYAALIQFYRNENLKHRSEPPPPYFDNPVNLNIGRQEPYDTSADVRRLAVQKKALKGMSELRVSLQREVEQAYAEFRERITVEREDSGGYPQSSTDQVAS